MIENILKLILSVCIGWILGKERKKRDKNGGSRTLAIMCLSACLISILSQKIEALGVDTFNFSRLMAYTIAGISFIGNGIIIKNEQSVEGLTTASSLLICIIIGFCIGLGFYYETLTVSFLVYCLLDIKYWFNNEN